MALRRDPYLVKAVVHSSRVLSAFRSSGEALPLREVVTRSGLQKSMTFRLLYTLERCGLIEKVGENLYRSSLRPAISRSGSASPDARNADRTRDEWTTDLTRYGSRALVFDSMARLQIAQRVRGSRSRCANRDSRRFSRITG